MTSKKSNVCIRIEEKIAIIFVVKNHKLNIEEKFNVDILIEENNGIHLMFITGNLKKVWDAYYNVLFLIDQIKLKLNQK